MFHVDVDDDAKKVGKLWVNAIIPNLVLYNITEILDISLKFI